MSASLHRNMPPLEMSRQASLPTLVPSSRVTTASKLAEWRGCGGWPTRTAESDVGTGGGVVRRTAATAGCESGLSARLQGERELGRVLEAIVGRLGIAFMIASEQLLRHRGVHQVRRRRASSAGARR